MTKSTMVKEIANVAEMTQKDVTAVLDAIDVVIADAMKAGDTVKVNGVTYKTKEIPAKDGVSKLGGEEKPWHTDAYTAVAVKITKSLKELLK